MKRKGQRYYDIGAEQVERFLANLVVSRNGPCPLSLDYPALQHGTIPRTLFTHDGRNRAAVQPK